MIETSNGNVYCERCLKRLTKAEDLLKPRFVRDEKRIYYRAVLRKM